MKVLFKSQRYVATQHQAISMKSITQQEDIESYYDAHLCFAKALHSDLESKVKQGNVVENQVQCCSPQVHHRLEPGEMLVVNNHRMLHGRTAVRLNGGTRLFNASYILHALLGSYCTNSRPFSRTFLWTLMSSRVVSKCWVPSMTQTTSPRTSSTMTSPSLLLIHTQPCTTAEFTLSLAPQLS